MKIENVDVDKDEIMNCLDLAYHTLRYRHESITSAYDAARMNMPQELRQMYYKNPGFRKKLNSVLRYALRYGQSVIAYAEGKKKIYRMPKIDDRKLDNTDLELLIGLHDAANLGPSLYEK